MSDPSRGASPSVTQDYVYPDEDRPINACHFRLWAGERATGIECHLLRQAGPGLVNNIAVEEWCRLERWSRLFLPAEQVLPYLRDDVKYRAWLEQGGYAVAQNVAALLRRAARVPDENETPPPDGKTVKSVSGGGRRGKRPSTSVNPIDAVAAELRRLEGLGITKPNALIEYMGKPEGANLRAAVNAAKEAKPKQKRTGKPATDGSIIDAAKQRNRPRNPTS